MKKFAKYFLQCLENSSIHGFNHLTAKKRSSLEHLLWLVLVCIGIAGAIGVSLFNWRRFQDNPTVISMERDYKDWNTSFPSITICPHLKYNRQSILLSAKRLYPNKTEDAITFLEELYSATYKDMAHLGQGLPEDIVHTRDYVKHLFQNSYQLDYYKKSSKYLTKILTEMGICYSRFSNVAHHNSIENWWNKTWSIREVEQEFSGSPLGGQISALIINMSSGSEVYIHYGSEMPDSSSHFKILSFSYYLILKLTAFAVHSTNDVRSLSILQRKCRYLDESELNVSPYYSYNLCRMQCRVDLAMSLCGCIPHFYKTRDHYPVCDFQGLKCLCKNKTAIILLRTKGEKLCNCLPPCNDVHYIVIDETSFEWSYGTTLELQLQKYPRMQLKRDILFGMTDFLVSVGATGGLFLGCSILSFIEIVYYFTIHLFWYIYNHKL